MYADNTLLLSLMIITFCLAPGYFGNDVSSPTNYNEIHTIVDKADESARLSVIYFVSDDRYDSLFVALANEFPTAVFIKTDTKVVNYIPINIKNEPEIILHKYGMDEFPFSCDNQSQLETIILHRIDLEKPDYYVLCQKQLTKAEDLIQYQEQQKLINFGIKYPVDSSTLLGILMAADKSGMMCLVYRVIDTYNYDWAFSQYSTQFGQTVFIKIDTAKYADDDKYKSTVQTQPAISFYRFGCRTREFSLANPAELPLIIDYYEKLEKTEFCSLSDELNDVAYRAQSQLQQNQVESDIQRPEDETRFSEILASADRSDKLCLVYKVSNTDEYDEMFYNLATQFSSVEFIKIDINKIRTIGIKSAKQPAIYFYKYGCNTVEFSSTDENELFAIIQAHQTMEKKKFCNLLNAVPTDFVADELPKYDDSIVNK